MMKLLRSEENEEMVRLEEREKVLWIFLAVDQAFMDVYERGLSVIARRALATSRVRTGFDEGDPRVRDTLPKQATSPAVLEVDPKSLTTLRAPTRSDMEDEFEIGRIVLPGHVRAVRLVGDYPATKVEIDVGSLDGLSVHGAPGRSVELEVWSRTGRMASTEARYHRVEPRQVGARSREGD